MSETSLVVPQEGVVEVQIEIKDEPRLEDNIWGGGFADTRVVTLFLRTLTTSNVSGDFKCLEGGSVAASVASISQVSHGRAAIQRSNQLHPQLFLSTSWLLRYEIELFVLRFELGIC